MTRAQRAAAGLTALGVPPPLHEHARSVCKQIMGHAEEHGRKSVKEHVKRLKEIERDIRKARDYIRGLK